MVSHEGRQVNPIFVTFSSTGYDPGGKCRLRHKKVLDGRPRKNFASVTKFLRDFRIS